MQTSSGALNSGISSEKPVFLGNPWILEKDSANFGTEG